MDASVALFQSPRSRPAGGIGRIRSIPLRDIFHPFARLAGRRTAAPEPARWVKEALEAEDLTREARRVCRARPDQIRTGG